MNLGFIPEFGAMHSILTPFCEVFITKTEEVHLPSLGSPQTIFNLPYVLISSSLTCVCTTVLERGAGSFLRV